MKAKFLALCAFIACLSLNAQKPEKVKFDGYYKNIPEYNLNIDGYTLQTEFDKYIQDLFAEKNLDLCIKGFEKGGEDLKLYFSVKEPEIEVRIDKGTQNIDGKTYTNYTAVVSASSESKLLMINKDGFPVKEIILEPNLKSIEKKGFPVTSKAAAEEEAKKIQKENASKIKKAYALGLFKVYQSKLDDLYGEFNQSFRYRVFEIKAKKFDYTEFNNATQEFVQADSVYNINSEDNQTKIHDAINIWKKYADEYTPGKKNKICDLNIDEINFNIAMGYLALGDVNNLEAYWNKCLQISGNKTVEFYSKDDVENMIQNLALSVENKDKPMQPLDNYIAKENYNTQLFLNSIFSAYLQSKWRDSYLTIHYFPAQPQLLKTATITKNYYEKSHEYLNMNYTRFGNISSLTYRTEKGYYPDKTYRYTFEYCNDGISKVLMNGNRVVFSVGYYLGNISSVVWNISDSKSITFSFENEAPGHINVQTTYAEGSKRVEGDNKDYIEYDENYNVVAFHLMDSDCDNQGYDKYGNVNSWTFTNPNNDQTATVSFDLNLDAKGNAVKINSDQDYSVDASYEYQF
ncbi:hypothetical protein [Plebeiibacterium sediminum]|uniref:Uncharacterized protein n=1 Tax=Plebeiibacterium sediminum TaxID=2992112 RepID=A0AAE3M2E9_9BACT|nr:hypothetical protein [Plebeiobacterium sediminum]MCW3785721.1 hypothetical protein [Plebeiobacterium sediminum]